jgi:hypothetical protein
MGYASKLFDGLKERITKEQKMVLSSLENTVLFYENYDFRWTRESLNKYPILHRPERKMRQNAVLLFIS